MEALNRRELFVGAAAVGALGLAGCSSDGRKSGEPSVTTSGAEAHPAGKDAPFDTVVVLMMENRSFDHLLGWLPGADGKQEGLTFRGPDREGVQAVGDRRRRAGLQLRRPEARLHARWSSRSTAARWTASSDRAGRRHFPISYYGKDDLSRAWRALAQGYTTSSTATTARSPGRRGRTASTSTAPRPTSTSRASSPARSATTSRSTPRPTPSKLELAIWDRLAEAGLTGEYYFHTEPMTGLFQSRQATTTSRSATTSSSPTPKAGNAAQRDVRRSRLRHLAELTGPRTTYHPHGSVLVGEGSWPRSTRRCAPARSGSAWCSWSTSTSTAASTTTSRRRRCEDDTVNPDPDRKADYNDLGFRVPGDRGRARSPRRRSRPTVRTSTARS